MTSLKATQNPDVPVATVPLFCFLHIASKNTAPGFHTYSFQKQIWRPSELLDLNNINANLDFMSLSLVTDKTKQ